MKTFTIRKVNSERGFKETIIRGTMNELKKRFREMLNKGYEFDKTIKVEPRNIRELVSGLNKSCYENRDYFIEYFVK